MKRRFPLKHAAGLVALMGFGTWAEAAKAQPALFFMTRQALWMEGRHYQKATVVMTFFAGLSALAVLTLLVLGARALVVGHGHQIPDQLRAAVLRASRHRGFAGAALLAVWVLVAAVAIEGPRLSGFVGYLMVLGLTWLSIGLPVALCILFEGVLPARSVRGPIASIEVQGEADAAPYWIVIAGHRFYVEPAIGRTLQIGMVVTIVRSAILNLVFAISTATSTYRTPWRAPSATNDSFER